MADAPLQSVLFSGDNPVRLNAFQLRDVSPIPEPSTYVFMLAGLAIIGAVATRRRKSH